MPLPFEVSYDEVKSHLEIYVDSICSSLASDFVVMPKGDGFVEFDVFEEGYEALKRGTASFKKIDAAKALAVVAERPIALIVLRTMLGFTPSELAYETRIRSKVLVTQGQVRSLDRKIRMGPTLPLISKGEGLVRLKAIVETACALIIAGPSEVPANQLHRLDKADTEFGTKSLLTVAQIGVPYSVLLYERFLGRPFAGHRDSVSELIGGGLETAIEKVLSEAGISFRKTSRAEKIPGFDQAPDFIIPSERNPKVVIEAKIAEDDGTARDKVTRVQHLASISLAGRKASNPRFQVVACIGGRGFAVRKEDMKKLLHATRGKVFTIQSLSRLVDCTSLAAFRSAP